MSHHIETIIRNTKRHYFEDGLPELFLGALALLGGTVLLFPTSPFQAGIWFVIGVILIARLQEWLRQRFIYPHSGYFLLREHKSQLWKSLLSAAVAIILVMAVLMIAFYLDFENALQWVPLVVGGFIGLVLLWKGAQLHLLRIVILGLYSTLTGALFSPLIWTTEKISWYSDTFYLGAYLFLFGIGAAISGGIRFSHHLRENHRVREANNER